MFYGHLDPADGLAVWVFTPGQNSDSSWQEYCDAIRAAARIDHPAPFGLQVIAPGSSDPPATWRRSIALAAAEVGERAAIAIVSRSVVVRGVLTAISWIRPPRYTLSMVATLDEAVALADAGAPGRGKRARELVERMLGSPQSFRTP